MKAVRHKHLSEVLYWRVCSRKTTANNGQVAQKGEVLVRNRHGSEWVMSAADFDAEYRVIEK